MANAEHLRLLQVGVGDWNRWRSEHPLISIDLQWASLRDADLVNVNLAGANLLEADLRGANLTKAKLTGATLVASEIVNADLSKANLQRADLSRAKLRGAKLTGADLRLTNLTGAEMREAKFSFAHFGETVLADVDLSGAVGLETCKSWAPTVIDHRTLIKSSKLPVSFLRACGLPEELIEILPMLFRSEIQYYTAFILASMRDQPFLERLQADLQARGLRCWLAPIDTYVPRLSNVQNDITELIPIHERLLIPVLSQNSVRNERLTKQVQASLQIEQLRATKLVFPLQIDAAATAGDWVGADTLMPRTVDFRRWQEPRFFTMSLSRLLEELQHRE